MLSNQTVTELQNSWTAEVRLNNGQTITIWYTAWHSIKDSVKDILSVSSDYPRHTLAPIAY